MSVSSIYPRKTMTNRTRLQSMAKPHKYDQKAEKTSYLRKLSKQYGLPHINPHAFRHTVASVLIANGTDIVTVSKQLGHSQVSTTSDVYSHVIEAAKAEATECIADVLLRRKQA